MGEEQSALALLAKKNRDEASAFSALRSQALAQDTSTPAFSLNSSEGLSALATALAPILVGALAGGKRGAAIGAGVGSTGIMAQEEENRAEEMRREKQNNALAQYYGKQSDAMTQSALKNESQLAGYQDKRDMGLGPKGTTINMAPINLGQDKVFARQMATSLTEEKAKTDKVLDNTGMVQTLLSSMEEGETVAGAIARGVKAKLFPSSDAAELTRQLQQWAVEEGKLNFPGTISDQERQFMMEMRGGNLGVTVGALRRIAARSELLAAAQYNRKLQDAAQFFKGETIPYKPHQMSASSMEQIKKDYHALPQRMLKALPDVGMEMQKKQGLSPEEEQLLKKLGI